MDIHESGEDYLEAILILELRNGYVRSVDVATELGYSKPAISLAMRRLKENGYVTTDEHGYLRLTGSGKTTANRVYEKHIIIARTLMALGVSEETAMRDACKIEHDISDESFSKIKKYYDLHNTKWK